jgi:predicted phosphoribosyltransferase
MRGNMKFRNRVDAGEQLGEFLATCTHEPRLVLAIPLGGIPVAAEIARILRAPLDVVLVGDVRVAPDGPVGAVALGAPPVFGGPMVEGSDKAARAVHEALSDLLPRLRGDRPLPNPNGRTVIIVDEGLETGYRALAAARMLRAHGATRVVVAAPVCSPAAEERLAGAVDELVYLECPEDFGTTQSYYEDFAPVTEAEGMVLLSVAGGGADVYGGAEIDGLASP